MKNLIVATAVALTLGMGAAQAEGDATAGAKVYKKCKICHALEPGKNKVGPSLHGIFDREAGTVEGFRYSSAMKGSGITWNDETITAYMKDPRGYIPKNKMAFPGLKKQADIDNLLAYLKQETM
ncbi:MAG: cytochrome c family protein [Minwuia sp.]|nr:cytochrome c family protein [Minwuia sp.]